MKNTKNVRKSKENTEEHLSARALSRATGLDPRTVAIRLSWGCGESSYDAEGRPTLRQFIADLDDDEGRKVLLFQIRRQMREDGE